MNSFLMLAAVLSGATTVAHVVFGGRESVGPLLESDVPWVPRMTHYYCWHLVSLTLAAMSLGYGYASLVPGGLDVAYLLTGLSLGFMAWSVLLGFWKRPKPWYALPQWVLFLGITGAAILGLL